MSSTSSLSACVRNRSSTEVGSISVLAQLNCKRVDALLEAHLAGLADQRQVFGVVDRQLHAGAVGHRGEIDVLRPGPPAAAATIASRRHAADWPESVMAASLMA